MRLLVTGGLGFIGSNFVASILGRKGFVSLVNMDNLSYGASKGSLRQQEEDPRYEFVVGDITNRALLSRYLPKVDAVVNFAAETHVDRSIANAWPFLKSNTEGVLSILEVMRRKADNIVMIQVSTDEVYGDVTKGSATEQGPLRPSSPYAASKASGDMLCLAFHRTYGLKIRVTRCTNNFGPRQFPEKFIPKTIIRAQLGLRVPIYGDGKNIRDWIFVGDHCDALMQVLRKGEDGEIYNIAGHSEKKNIDVVKHVLDIMGKPHDLIEYVKDRPGHDRRYSLDDQKIRDRLGWKPKSSFEDALNKTIRWYVENERWWRPLANETTLSSTPWKLGK